MWISRQKFPKFTKGHVDVMLAPSLPSVREIPPILERQFKPETCRPSSYYGAKVSNGSGRAGSVAIRRNA